MATTDTTNTEKGIEPSKNGTISKKKPSLNKKGSVTVRRVKPACDICNKKFKSSIGVAVHKRRIHIASNTIEPTAKRTSLLMRLDKLSNKWLKKASVEKDPKAVEAIFNCIMDLKSEFNRK